MPTKVANPIHEMLKRFVILTTMAVEDRRCRCFRTKIRGDCEVELNATKKNASLAGYAGIEGEVNLMVATSSF